MPRTGGGSTTAGPNSTACSNKRSAISQRFLSLGVALTAAITTQQRLAGASLMVFANKTDVEGCMSGHEMLEVGRSLRPAGIVEALQKHCRSIAEAAR